jgi:hypothetical protein
VARRSLALLSALLFAGSASAAELPERPLDLLIERSGLATQLEQFQAAMQRGITQAQSEQRRLGEDQVQRLRNAISAAYAPSGLRSALRTELSRTLQPADIAAALAWLDSPTGRRLAQLEAKAATPEAQLAIEAAARRGAARVEAARARMLRELVTVTRADVVGASLLIGTAIGVAEGAALFQPGDSSAALAATRREMNERRPEIEAAMREYSFTSFALVYAEASDAELGALLRFARSPAGARYHEVTAQAFESTLAQAAKRLGGALAAPAAPAGI